MKFDVPHDLQQELLSEIAEQAHQFAADNAELDRLHRARLGRIAPEVVGAFLDDDEQPPEDAPPPDEPAPPAAPDPPPERLAVRMRFDVPEAVRQELLAGIAEQTRGFAADNAELDRVHRARLGRVLPAIVQRTEGGESDGDSKRA